ncbi:MAG TPA: translocation and assembly module protein TamB, partial [Paracoccaceae bacterium]
MRRLVTILALAALPCAALPLAASAQQDDRGYLTAFLEDNLSGLGRRVTITGFEGALSSRAVMAELSVADADGVWITLRDVVLDWNRAALLAGRVEVNALTAAEIIVARAPVREDEALPAPEAQGFTLPELPVSVEIGRIAAERIELGETILGTALEGSLEAALSLAGGDGSATLALTRTDDGPEGSVALTASYGNASGVLAIDLEAREAAGGIAARLLGLPGAPAVELTVQGEGPVSDYTAEVRLASDGAERLAGSVTLQAPAEGGRAFRADLGGDLAPLFLPDYAAFFGPDVQLQTAGIRAADGRLNLSQLALRTRALVLEGSLALAVDGLPE